MLYRRVWLIPVVSVALSCRPGGTGVGGGPTPDVGNDSPDAGASVSKAGRTWRVLLVPGTYRYTMRREGSVAQLPDTGGRWLPVPTVTEKVTLRLRSDGKVDVVSPRVSTESKCTQAQAIAARGAQLIPHLPAVLIEGTSWSDSTETSGCRGSVPATVTAINRYTVAGDSTIEGIAVVLLKRTGTLAASGEGSEGQHRILLNASGVDSTEIAISLLESRVVSSVSRQSTRVDVTTSGRTTHFAQRTTETVRIE